MAANPIVAEYEVFKNARNALAFFFYKHPSLDGLSEDGPFWFVIENGRIVAGDENNHAIFEDVSDPVLQTAKQRGVIMLVEFENQQPVRCTPCYLTDQL